MDSNFGPVIDPIGRYTVGFLKMGHDSVSSAGSGTFVRFGPIAGILTCAHVLEEVERETEVGILLFPAQTKKTQTLRIYIDHTEFVCFGKPPWGINGPDLGFLKLAPADAIRFESLASFANGELQARRAMNGEPPHDHKVSIAAGVIAEQTGKPKIEGSLSTTPFNGLLNVGGVIEKERRNEFDYYRFNPIPSPDFNLPESYQGTSGGGLWTLYFGDNDRLLETRLCGVAFYETGGDPNQILCHGQEAVYGALRNAIHSKWPNG